MFDLGWTELLVIGVVALIVVGPKDLPVLFRNVGRFVGRAKGMAREFTSAMNDAADQSGARDLQKTLNSVTKPLNTAMDKMSESLNASLEVPDIEAKAPAKPKLTEEQEADRKRIELSAAKAAAQRKAREAEAAVAKANALEAELGGGTKPASED